MMFGDEDDKTLIQSDNDTLVSAQDKDRLYETTSLDTDELISADDKRMNQFGVLGAVAQNIIEVPATLREAGLKKEFYFNGAMEIGRGAFAAAVSVFNPLLGAGLSRANATLGSVLSDAETAMKIVDAREKRQARLEGFGYDVTSTGAQVGGAIAQGIGFAATAAIGGEPAAVALMAGQSALAGAEKYVDVLAQTENPQLAFARGAGSAILNYATEKIGMDGITAKFTPLLERNMKMIFARAITGAVAEGGEEMAQSFGEQGMDILMGDAEGIDFQQVALSGVFGMIGGGAGGLSYASMYRRKLFKALDATSTNYGVKMTPEQKAKAVDEVMAGTSVGFTDLVLQNAGVDQNMADSITKRRQRVMGMPEQMSEGITNEDVGRMMDARNKYTSAVDEVMSQLPTTETSTQTVQPQNAAEVTMRLKTIEGEATALMRTYTGLQADSGVSEKALREIGGRIQNLFIAQGATAEQAQRMREIIGLNDDIQAHIQEVAKEDIGYSNAGLSAVAKTAEELSKSITQQTANIQALAAEKRVESFARKTASDFLGMFKVIDAKAKTKVLNKLRQAIKTDTAIDAKGRTQRNALLKAGDYGSLLKEYNGVFSEADFSPAVPTQINSFVLEKGRQIARIAEDVSEAKSRVAATRKAVEYIRSFAKELNDKKRDIREQLSRDKFLLATAKSVYTERLSELKQKRKDLADAIRSATKEFKTETRIYSKLEEHLDDLVAEYEDLVVERREVAQGKQTNGRILTTMAKVRTLRLKELREQLTSMAKARRATKQELISVTNSLRRLIRSTGLKQETKNELIARLKAGVEFKDLFTVYPKIQMAIDTALEAQKKNAAIKQLTMGINMLKHSAFEADRGYASELSKAVRSGTIPTKSYGKRYDAILKQAVLATQGSPLFDANGIADLASDIQMLSAESKGRLSAISKMNETKAQTLREVTDRAVRGRIDTAATNRMRGDVVKTKEAFRLGASIADLFRNLNFISPEVARTFDINAPHSSFTQGMATANNTFIEFLKKRGPMWAKKVDFDSDPMNEAVVFETRNEAGNPVVARTTPARARSIYASTRNIQARNNFLKSGQLTEKGIEDIEKWINLPENAEHKTLVEDEMKLLESYLPRVQAMVREIFPTADFTGIKDYFMTRRILDPDTNADFYNEIFGNATTDAEIKTASALKKRTGGTYTFKIEDDIKMMQSYIASMEHFLAYGQYVQNLKRYIAGNKDTLTKAFGQRFVTALDTQTNALRDAAAIRSAAFSANNLVQSLYRNAARSLTRGPTQLPKQLVGMYTSTANPIELTNNLPAVLAYVTGDTKSDPLLDTIGKTAKASERFGEHNSYSILTTSVGQPSRTFSGDLLKQKLNNITAIFPRTGDKIAYMNVAYTKTKELMRGGMNELDAIAQGINEADTSQTTQNPARIALPALTSGGGNLMTSVFTLSQTTFQMYNRYMTEVESAATEWKKGNKAKALKQFGDVAAKWHGIVPMTYTLAAAGLTAETAQYLSRMLVGPAGELPITGDIINSVWSVFALFIEKITQDEDGEKTVHLAPGKYATDNTDLIASLSLATGKALVRMADAASDEEYIKSLIAGAEAAAIIGGLSTGIPMQELAKVSGSVYDNIEAGVDATNGMYPWMLALAGYSRNTVKKARGEE